MATDPRIAIETVLDQIQTEEFTSEVRLLPLITQISAAVESPPVSDSIIDIKTQLDSLTLVLSNATGIDVKLKEDSLTPAQNIQGSPCRFENAPGLKRLLVAVSPARRSYSRTFLVDRVGLRRILVCEDLRLSGFRVTGTTDKSSGTLFISHNIEHSVDPGASWPSMIQHCFHHEVFHLIEGQYSRLCKEQFRRWETLRPAKSKYGRHGLDVARFRAAEIEETYRENDLDRDRLLDFYVRLERKSPFCAILLQAC